MTGLIILAAGGSKRLGRPKQNLQFKGQTLLQRVVEAGKGSICEKIIVVLGANSNEIAPIQGTTTVYNEDWMEGMSSSIRKGISNIYNNPLITRVIIMLCDQPFVNTALLNSLINKQMETGKSIIACAYNNTIGVPVLFDRSVFAELLLLRGTEGAKTILISHAEDIDTVPFEKGSIDIDTPEDYEQLQRLSD